MPKITDCTHPRIGEELTAIAGHYIWHKIDRLPYRGREVLYMVGAALIDTGCCGPSGCGFATVAGFIVDWKYRATEAGEPVSRIEEISNAAMRNEIEQRIRKSEGVQQVRFQP